MKIIKMLLFAIVFIINNEAQDLPELLQNKIETIQQRDSIYGIAASVMIGEQLVWKGTAGYSNPFTKDTITTDMTASIGSNTKMFTSVIILQLQEEGKLSIDQSIDNWITPTAKIDGSITIKQLLNHTSGIADYTTDAWVDSFKINPSRIWNTQDLIDTFVGLPDFEPGSSWNYSNTGYFLLGEIIEQIEGKSYHEVLHERIFTPMELNSMYTPIEDETTGTEITPWVDFEQNGNRINLFEFGSMMAMHSSAWAAGYIYSTPADLTMFGYKLFNEEIINENSLSEMKSFVSTGDDIEYGLGLIKTNDFGTDLYGHNGQYIGYTAIILYEPETEMTVALFTNVTYVDINKIGHEVAELVYNSIITSVENENEKMIDFQLMQNYPNPFNPSTTISYSIPEASHVSLKVFDSLGREVAELANSVIVAGNYELNFDASKLASGIYFYTLKTDEYFNTKKMLLIK